MKPEGMGFLKRPEKPENAFRRKHAYDGAP